MKVNLRDISSASRYDPASALLAALGNIDGLEIFHHYVLIGMYVAPARVWKGPNGEDVEFIESDKKLDEWRWQGKAGLVVAKGPNAFKDDDRTTFGGINPALGDWVFAKPADGLEVFIGEAQKGAGISCRIFADRDIIGRVPDPSMIY